MYCRLSDLTPQSLREYPVIAMRRIIKEPKRWTVEDKKAGRLPEVGSKFENLFTKKTMEVLFKDEKVIITLNVIDSLATNFTHKQFLECNKPIETPEEKSERLRGEWVELAFDNMMRKEGLHSTECLDRMKCHFGSVYDALLSGTLSAPTKGGE